MTQHALAPGDVASDEIPFAPSVEDWRAMSAGERERFLQFAMDALNRKAELMPEGRPHSRAKSVVATVLGDYFERIGRRVYLANELPVHYPGARVFAPDLIAVLDVEDPGDADERMAWVVAEEGQGIDLALEIIHSGDRHKDLVQNVVDFARLGIEEYFVYDRMRQKVYGYRMPDSKSGPYTSIPSRGGRLWSSVLELELGVAEGRLRFFHEDGAEVPETRALLSRANALVDEAERRVEAEAQARVEAERRAESEARLRAELEAQIAELRAKLGG